MTFLENDDRKMAQFLHSSFKSASSADIAVAFIRRSGVRAITKDIVALRRRNGRIRVLTGLHFGLTEAEALLDLQRLGVHVKVYAGKCVFHPKAYLFKSGVSSMAVVGSSNLTASGLDTAIEWNLLVQRDNAKIGEIHGIFNKLWKGPSSVPLSNNILSQLRRMNRNAMRNRHVKAYTKQIDLSHHAIEFDFCIGKAFLKYSHHPITIRKREWNAAIRGIRTSAHCEITIVPEMKRYHGSIYTSRAGWGKFYQLRFLPDGGEDIQYSFKRNQVLAVRILFEKNRIRAEIQRQRGSGQRTL